ncbi:MAG TPA: hypothetical protein GXZ76_07785 [Clostridiaceae bacterium]|nr:hypothetical protein [Clostridiaceae bacterium]
MNKSKTDKRKQEKTMKMAILIVFSIISVLFTVYVLMSRFLPLRYAAVLILIIVFLNFAVYFLLLTKKKKWKTILSAILMVISLIVFALGAFALRDVNRAISKVSSAEETDIYSIIVMNNNPYKMAIEVEQEDIALVESGQQALIQELLPNNRDYETNAYSSYPELVEALYEGTEQFILFDEAFREIVYSVHANFDIETRVLVSTNPNIIEELKNAKIRSPLEYYDIIKKDKADKPEKGDYTEYESKKVENAEPFTMLISGIDTYGHINTKSRSDVNIVLAINPQKHEILMVPVVRDAYVTIAGTGFKDKLTHAGVLGVETTKNSVANALGMPIDAYVKVNFTTLVELVDTLGGVTVDNPIAFSAFGNHFSAGKIRLNGAEALAFSRERKSLAGGDFDRGMNQTRVIKGLINEVIQPQNITKFSTILEQLSDSFITDLSDQAIRSIVQNQLNTGGSWTVNSTSITAQGQMGLPSYMMPGYSLYFAVLNEDSVVEARNQLLAVLE